jgi:hypothetical protein
MRAWTALLLVFLNACAHTVHMTSEPPGAMVTIDGQPIGRTPVDFDEQTGRKTYQLRVEKDGYQAFETSLSQDFINTEYAVAAGAGAAGVAAGGCFGGLFVCWPVYWGGGLVGAGLLVYSIFQNKQLKDRYHFRLEPAPVAIP